MSSYGQTDALAMAIVDRISTLPLCMDVLAERRYRLLDLLPNIPKVGEPVSVGLYPDEERSERQGISTAFASLYAVHVYIQQQVSDAEDEEAQCALLTRLRSEIIEDLKLRAFSLDDAVHPVSGVFLWQIRNSHENGPARGLYNLARLMNDHVYESDTILIFKASA